MSDSPVRILLVEDNPGDARLLRELLRESGSLPFDLTHVDRLEAARQRMQSHGADVVLLDLSLPDGHGIETVRRMLDAAPEAPILVLTGLNDEATAVKAVQEGAQDYLVKGTVEPSSLARAVRYAVERKRLERERMELLRREQEARAAAEAAVRARDEVLRVVSHDLGNSLSAVRITATVLLRTLSADLPDDRVRQGIVNIGHLVDEMQRLRQDLLDVAVIEAGQLTVDRAPHAPAALVADAVERYRPVAADKSLSLVGSATDALPDVYVDRTRILQVLANLITNAIKFTPEGGEITVGAESDPHEVRFFTRDSGPGIPREHLKTIFDRFWKTAIGNRQGAGLGLAIAQGIVTAHGGRIWAESDQGSGSTFYFTIPLAR